LPQRARLRSQDGFIREAIWIFVILTVIAVVILDGMAIFNAYQSAGDSATNAADAARTDYAQTTNAADAKLAADEYLAKKGLEMKGFKAVQTPDGTVQFTVTARATADTYAFHYLASIPPLKDWVERTLHPTRTGNAQ
jgi:Flp pilus assembly protein TadG